MTSVKSWRNALAGGAAAIGASGCALHTTGLVHHTTTGTYFESNRGRNYRLVLVGDALPMGWLDGLEAEVWGRAALGTLTVKDWKTTEGPHGLQTFCGDVESRGVQIGMLDRNSGSYYFIDPAGAAALEPYVGLPALLEGWVDGPQRIHVVDFRLLADEPKPRSELP